ncbi:MAG TPA: hypothetical protein P5205_08750 [Candidatus Paceibacterota bacterium]|nr:hypothetical protein [Verrucomicrobiota bacterium]HSA10446.1 hypothetical protein [Candidatus Paceibacterota bacterium]
MRTCTLGILSDVHYASAAEQARGKDYEFRGLSNPLARALGKAYRRFIWLREPLRKNYLLDRFLESGDTFDYVIANGDYSCDCAFIGLSDDAAFASARECLGKLRQRFGDRLRINYGDHEMGKISMFGGGGGMRLASWQRARNELALPPFWRVEIGRYVLMGFVSSLVALPAFAADILPAERSEWDRLRAEHLAEISHAFAALSPGQRVLLFGHDPTALPFLWREKSVRDRITQVELTIVGHLHSNLVLWKSRLLAGMPPIRILGHSVQRFSKALNEATCWRPFRIRLCPSLAGIELLKDGGYCTIEFDPEARCPASFRFHRLRR